MLEKYNKIWKSVSSIVEREFYCKKYLKTKIKSYNGKFNTHFYKNKIPKEGFQCICLSVILIDSVYEKYKNYYPQGVLEERKYIVYNFYDDIEISSNDSDKEDSDDFNKEYSDDSNKDHSDDSDKENPNEES